MSDYSKEPLPPCEIKTLLEDKPYLVQRLGHVANNAGIFEEFKELVEKYHCDLAQLRSAVRDELAAQGVSDIDGVLSLCDIPSPYED